MKRRLTKMTGSQVIKLTVYEQTQGLALRLSERTNKKSKPLYFFTLQVKAIIKRINNIISINICGQFTL